MIRFIVYDSCLNESKVLGWEFRTDSFLVDEGIGWIEMYWGKISLIDEVGPGGVDNVDGVEWNYKAHRFPKILSGDIGDWCLYKDEESSEVIGIKFIQILFEVFSIGLNVVFIEATGCSDEIDDGFELLIGDRGVGVVAES